LALRHETAIHPKVRHTFNRVAAHLAAAMRLRLALGGVRLLDAAHAVLGPDGRCLHALEPEKRGFALERLRQAARTVDTVNGRLARSNPEEALALWTGLFAGRWTVLESFDTDGKRFVVALRNEPLVAEDRALTRRERQVASLAAVGQSDKLIAYTLGLAESTIRTHLRRGLRKLALADRRALARVAEALLGPHSARTEAPAPDGACTSPRRVPIAEDERAARGRIWSRD
jgi:DNA-binding CsgD family transcriptional regulator